MDDKALSLLAAADLAPARALNERELRRRDDLLRDIVCDTGDTTFREPAPARPSLLRRVLYTAGATIAAGTAAAVVLSTTGGGADGPLSSSDLSAWTSVPTAADASQGAGRTALGWCLNGITEAAPHSNARSTTSNADFRGKVASMIVTRGSTATFCVVGPDGKGMWEVIDPAASVPLGSAVIGSAGVHGAGASGVGYAEGSVGADVTALTLHTAGHTVHATLQGRRWTAWWPDTGADTGGTATLKLAGGQSRTVNLDSLYQ